MVSNLCSLIKCFNVLLTLIGPVFINKYFKYYVSKFCYEKIELTQERPKIKESQD
jgi:hypothetical protein